MTPRKLFEWAKENILKCHFAYVTQEDHEREEALLAELYESSRSIPGTYRKHSFVPINKEVIKTKLYSNSDFFLKEKVTVSCGDTNKKTLKDLLHAYMVEIWWFLHPHGPSPSFTYPLHSDILTVPK